MLNIQPDRWRVVRRSACPIPTAEPRPCREPSVEMYLGDLEMNTNQDDHPVDLPGE